MYDIWDIIPGRTVSVSVEGVIDDWEGFRILLRDHDTDRIIRIAFDSEVAYLRRDESDLVGDGLGRGCFYRVMDSEFAARFRTDTVRQFGELKHFAIVTDVHCVDVLATDEPKIDCL